MAGTSTSTMEGMEMQQVQLIWESFAKGFTNVNAFMHHACMSAGNLGQIYNI